MNILADAEDAAHRSKMVLKKLRSNEDISHALWLDSFETLAKLDDRFEKTQSLTEFLENDWSHLQKNGE